jgi:hypothetical protein
LPCGPGRAPPGGFRRDSCRAKTAGHPWPAPCGPYPVKALAYATGPEGETRRLFRSLRFVGSSAPLALRRATVFSSAIRAAQSAKRSASRGKRMATPRDALQIRVETTHDALPIPITGVCTPAIHLTLGKSRRVPPSGPVAQARAPTGQGPQGPAMDGRPFSRDRSRVENPQPEPDPARRAIK